LLTPHGTPENTRAPDTARDSGRAGAGDGGRDAGGAGGRDVGGTGARDSGRDGAWDSGGDGGRLVLLASSPRVAPGQLTVQAWDALRGAARVLAGPAGHPQLPALADAGISVRLVAAADAGDADDPAELARALAREAAAVGGDVVWLAGPDGDEATAALLAALGKRPGGGPEVTLLTGSRDLPGARLLDLVATMDTLRVRCPWDAKQTHESLAPHLLEESYEALEALEDGDQAALREELGDVLLQVMFHSRVAAERTDGTGYTVDDVADGIVAKLVRRHPHVFAEVEVSGADEVKQNWDTIKAAERAARYGRPTSVLDGVPFGQPALALAAQLQRRAERSGVPAALATPPAKPAQPADASAPPADASAPPADGSADLADGAVAPDAAAPGEALGEELFALAARARAAGLDPELELRAAARRYRDRVHAWEQSHPNRPTPA
jgi:XTP/dITP diphosphohydrolase